MRTALSLFLALSTLFITFHPTSALADGGSSEVVWMRLILTANRKLTPTTTLTTRLIPAANLRGPLAPLAFIGVKRALSRGFWVEPSLGWFSPKNEPFLSLRLGLKQGNLMAALQADYRFFSRTGYGFALASHRVADGFLAGAETEWSSSYASPTSGSWGGGPHLRLLFGQTELAIALHLDSQVVDGQRKAGSKLVLRYIILL